MLTREDDVEIHALHQRGWSISAIARHTGRNRRTIRNYLTGVTSPGVRRPVGEDSFAPFVDYVSLRLGEDPHLWARTLCDELEELGFALSYPSLTRNIRVRGLRPVCAQCRSVTERPNAVIDHDPGDETQWDWLDLPDPPPSWGWGRTRICWSGRWRIRASGVRRWSRRPISRTWWRVWTGSPGRWAG
jgi:transposase